MRIALGGALHQPLLRAAATAAAMKTGEKESIVYFDLAHQRTAGRAFCRPYAIAIARLRRIRVVQP